MLIPPEDMSDFIRRTKPYYLKRKIVGFVRWIGVADHPLGPRATVEGDIDLGDVVVVAGPFQPGELSTPLQNTGKQSLPMPRKSHTPDTLSRPPVAG